MDLTNKSIEELRAIKSAEICELKKELKEIINKKSYNEVEAPIKSENNGKTAWISKELSYIECVIYQGSNCLPGKYML